MAHYDPKITEIKQRNVQVFKETTVIIKNGYYMAPSGKRVNLDMQPMIDGGRCYHKELTPVNQPKVEGGTKIIVEHGDCLKVAERLVKNGYHPALLNFAGAGHPGGGVARGARAQEETICRRSTLTRSLFSFDDSHAKRYGYAFRAGNHYPISQSLNFSMIYSPEVTVFREAGQEYTLMEEPFNIGVITNAALNLGGHYDIHLTLDGHMPERAKDITRNKIRAIMRVGLIKGHDSLVLGAFGCGAFHTPPREMAQLFKEVMSEDEFIDRYRLITFAILSDHNDPGSNYNSFKEIIGGDIVSPSSDAEMVTSPTHSPKITPTHITHLEPNEVFVFGSNLQGMHGGGAAHFAHKHFGAEWGVGVGPTGQCYAIPTMQGGVETIRPYVDQFVRYAAEHPEQIFFVTPIGCGIAGFREEGIAPLFAAARDLENVALPKGWREMCR